MDFIKALELAVSVIRENDGLDEIYLYERNTQVQVCLKDCENSLQFDCDESLPKQIFLAACYDKYLKSKCLSLSVIFSTEWEVRLWKKEHLRAIRTMETGEVLLGSVGREEVADV